jgi:hypothetical protein
MATIEDLTALTPEQQRAWNRFEKAFNDFKKAGGKFYTVLETVTGYNGKHVKTIENDGDHSLMFKDIGPHIFDAGLAGFADDEHFITFKNGVEVDD